MSANNQHQNVVPLAARCRALGQSLSDSSFHVEYTVDEDSREVVNLTHAKTTDSEAIEERGEYEVVWIAQIDPDEPESLDSAAIIQVLVSVHDDCWTLNHKITAHSAEQLSDVFAKIAVVARQIERQRSDQRAAEETARRELDARQGALFESE